jgi:hypothetical protein
LAAACGIPCSWAGGGNGLPDVFLYEVGGATRLVSRTAASATTTGDGFSEFPSISADGRFVAFYSGASNLVTGQVASPFENVFVYDRVADQTTLVSRAGSATTPGNGESLVPVISADGRFVAFVSFATDLVAGQVDRDDTSDVFLYDRVAETMTLGSRTSTSAVTTGNDSSSGDDSEDKPLISGDGRFVAFQSRATDLVAGQLNFNDSSDTFLFDREAGTTTLISQAVSRKAGRGAPTGDGFSEPAALSADGTVLLFRGRASNLSTDEDRNGQEDVFVWVRPCADQPAPRPCPGEASRSHR